MGSERIIITELEENYFEFPKKRKYSKNRKRSTVDRKEYEKQWRMKNKEQQREYNKAYQRNHYKKYPDKYLYWSIKYRAKQKGLPFDLELSDIIIPEVCPILGIPIQRNIGGLSRAQNSLSIDRIIPELGYVKNNIQVISMRANVMKNDASVEELRKFAEWVQKTFPR